MSTHLRFTINDSSSPEPLSSVQFNTSHLAEKSYGKISAYLNLMVKDAIENHAVVMSAGNWRLKCEEVEIDDSRPFGTSPN